MLRYINTFTRFIWLLIIPLIVAPLLGAGALKVSTSYTATASLWTEVPLFLQSQRTTEGNNGSPASQTLDMLKEQLSTRTFMVPIIQETTTLKGTKNESELAALALDVSKNIKLDATGWRLITLTYKSNDEKAALEVLNGVVNHFKAQYEDRITTQSQGSIAFYQKQLKAANDELDSVTNDLKKFLEAKGDKLKTDGYTRPLTADDLDYNALILQRDQARKVYDDTRISLDKVQNAYNAYQQGQDIYIRIEDKPDITAGASTKSLQMILGIGIGLIIGLVLTVGLTVLLTMLDNTFRQPAYASQWLKLNRVLELPEVKPKRAFRRGFSLRHSLATQIQTAKTPFLDE